MGDNIINDFLDNFKKLFYPEEWLALDMAFSKSELFALLLVDRHGEVIMSQIADYINVSMSTANGIAERLVSKGYLLRERSESDRRIVVIKLADKGREVVDGLKSTINKYIELVTNSLTNEEKKVLTKVIMKVIGLMSEAKIQDNKDEKTAELKSIKIE